MIHAYNESYLSTVVNNVAELFNIAINVENVNPNDFANKFAESAIANGIERSNPRMLAGLSSLEMVHDLTGAEISYDKIPSQQAREYWAGKVLAYAQWFYDKSFKMILQNCSFKDIISLYDEFGRGDILEAVKKIHECFPSDTNLKRIRQLRMLTQKELADYSGVKIRAIQGYEQKDNDINKAQGETLYALAKTLNCRIEDLLE